MLTLLDRPPQPPMKDVSDVLRFLGYRELRTAAGGDWRPIDEVNGRFGTTDETHILTGKNRPTCRLVNAESGELVATARKSCPAGGNGAAGDVTPTERNT